MVGSNVVREPHEPITERNRTFKNRCRDDSPETKTARNGSAGARRGEWVETRRDRMTVRRLRRSAPSDMSFPDVWSPSSEFVTRSPVVSARLC